MCPRTLQFETPVVVKRVLLNSIFVGSERVVACLSTVGVLQPTFADKLDLVYTISVAVKVGMTGATAFTYNVATHRTLEIEIASVDENEVVEVEVFQWGRGEIIAIEKLEVSEFLKGFTGRELSLPFGVEWWSIAEMKTLQREQGS